MSDRYAELVRTPVGKIVAGNIGLPQPVKLDRYSPGDPLVDGTVLIGAAPGGRLIGDVARVLAEAGAEVATELDSPARQAAADAGLDAGIFNGDTAEDEVRFKALVFDASGIQDSEQLQELWAFFQPTIRRVERSGRVVVLGTPPEDAGSPEALIAQRALEGFTRAVGKEVRKGAAANLIYVAPGAEGLVDASLRFLLSPRSAYVSGQVVLVGEGDAAPSIDWELPLEGKVALVTGASRGIGLSIAEVLRRDGATVVGLDVAGDDMDLVMDITEEGAPRKIAHHLKTEHGKVDIVVHNAGITRDKTLGRMDLDRWKSTIDVNLRAPELITAELVKGRTPVLKRGGRVIGVSSISGIAGNAGQTNYSTSKAGVIGFVRAFSDSLREKGITVNAVAPGFIETKMTAAMPFGTREAGRRMNSMNQGGLPVDVAEAVAWFASPASGGVTGNVVRVCGQSLLGA
jgi:3-oxoacyl-[acyl-carrier protein] reductase